MKFKKSAVFFLCALSLSLSMGGNRLWASDKIRIVATTSNFSSIAQEITGERADIYFIASPRRDIHFIAPTPKDMVKLKKADVFIHGGLDLEAWRGPLLNVVGRLDLMGPSGARQIDVSKGITLLEVPTSLSRAQGDLHLYGNPHYWLDPENGKIIAHNIAEGLAQMYPDQADLFRKNAATFSEKLDRKIKEWDIALSSFKGVAVVTYHRSWPYFLEHFGLTSEGELEPKPGIPPTARHLAELENNMRKNKVKAIIKETCFENRTPEKVAKETGATVVIFAQAVGEVKETGDYISMFDYNVSQLAGISQKARP